MTRAAIYCRVSTHDQQTLPMQLRAAREFAERRGWEVTQEVTDSASGASVRPARDALLAAARRRQLDAIVVWKLDRWGRSSADLFTSLAELDACGCVFTSVTEGLDFSTPSGRALVGMLSVFASFERDLIRERVRAGVAEARRRGTHCGRAGLKEAEVAQILELRSQGKSIRAIADALGVGVGTVHSHLPSKSDRTSG